MMITRNVSGLSGIGLCLLLSGTANADTTVAAEEKPEVLQLSDVKAHHPCARKSADTLNKKALPFLESIQTHAKKYGVDHDLVKSVITIESCYQQQALSPKGAQGLMQLIPATAERFGISNVYDTDQNVRGGTQYLSWLSKRFGGDLEKVLAGYNAGEGRVDEYNGIPPFRETRNYVHDVLLVYKKLKAGQQVVVQAKANKEEQQRQAQLALEYKQQQQARQQQARLAEQKRLAALTPDQRRREARQAQLVAQMRQRQQSARQAQLVAQIRQREQSSQTHEIITGQVSSPIRQQPAQPPVLRQVSAKIVKNADGTPVAAQNGRVQSTYSSPFKPGRAGREANKQLAPQLYKQQ